MTELVEDLASQWAVSGTTDSTEGGMDRGIDSNIDSGFVGGRLCAEGVGEGLGDVEVVWGDGERDGEGAGFATTSPTRIWPATVSSSASDKAAQRQQRKSRVLNRQVCVRLCVCVCMCVCWGWGREGYVVSV